MTVHPVTVNLSEPVYRRVQRAAERTQRSVEQLLGDALAALTPENSNLPPDLQTALNAGESPPLPRIDAPIAILQIASLARSWKSITLCQRRQVVRQLALRHHSLHRLSLHFFHGVDKMQG